MLLAAPDFIDLATGASSSDHLPLWVPFAASFPFLGLPLFAGMSGAVFGGRTPGMALVGIRVARQDGSAVSLARLGVRTATGLGLLWFAMLGPFVVSLVADPLQEVVDVAIALHIPAVPALVAGLALFAALAPIGLLITSFAWARLDEQGRTWPDLVAGTAMIATR
jgi:uncharacterized RDD family membrane protein YckC